MSTEHKGLKSEKLQAYLVELEEKLVLAVETPWKYGELLKKLVYTRKSRSLLFDISNTEQRGRYAIV